MKTVAPAVARIVAQLALRLPANVEGDYFVDSTCIDCDACRVIAPATFVEAAGQSAVGRQPSTDEERLAANKALVSCPTASIGSRSRAGIREALAALPEELDEDLFRCGYTSESSFGAISYFVRGTSGNTLVDSPRFTAPLVRELDRRGGVRRMLLTHQDDVADHRKFHEHFGCTRVLHRDDVRRETVDVEQQPEGSDPLDLGDGMVMLPTPGHTKGHAVYLWRERVLFTGDHLAWSPRRGHLYAFRSACWYSWCAQIESMERLLNHSFEWVLPGHGRPVRMPRAAMKESLLRCIDWMKSKQR